MTNLVSLLITAVTLAPQTPDPPESYLDPRYLTWPDASGYGNSGVYKRSCAGRFTGDDVHHVVTLRGNSPVMAFDPIFCESFIALGLTSQDIETLPGGGEIPNSDALISVGSSGLIKSVVDQDLWVFTHETLSAGSWNGAVMVRVADVNDDGYLDIVGLSSNRKTVRCMNQQSNGSFTTGDSFMADGTVTAMECFQWDGLAGEEIAVVTSAGGLRIYESDGTLLDDFGTYQTTGNSLAVLDGPEDVERLAWLTAYSATEQMIGIIDNTGLVESTLLGNWTVAVISSGDADGNSVTDLALSMKSHTNPRVLINQGDVDAPEFSRNTGEFIIETVSVSDQPASTNQAMVLVTRLSTDLYDDMYFPWESEDKIFVAPGALEDGSFYPPSMNFDANFEASACTDGLLRASVSGHFTTTPTAIEMVVWYQSDCNNPTSENAILHCIDNEFSNENGTITFQVELESPPGVDWATDEYLLYMFVRPVTLNGSGQIVSSGMPLIGAIALDRDEAGCSLSCVQKWSGWSEIFDGCHDGPPGGEVLGFVRASGGPNFSWGSIPVTGDNCTFDSGGV